MIVADFGPVEPGWKGESRDALRLGAAQDAPRQALDPALDCGTVQDASGPLR